VDDVRVALPQALARFALPEPPTGNELRATIWSSLEMLGVAPDEVSIPLYGATWRAVLAPADFLLHIAGPTGTGETELAALYQQHFGAGLDSRNLPTSWVSTPNAIEGLGFHAKDSLMVVDDFAPTGSSSDIQRHHREADRVFRAQGNNAGRQRMRADASLRPEKKSRALLLSTGEDVPRGQSLRARVLVLELSPREMNWDFLGRCQQQARAGVYSRAMAGFLQFVAPRYDSLSSDLRGRVRRLRREAMRSAMHKRTPEIVANLGVGIKYFIDYGVASGALTSADGEELWSRAWKALGKAAEAQVEQQAANDPVKRFIQLLSSAIASGRAHVAGVDGEPPKRRRAWGWTFSADRARPAGSRVGVDKQFRRLIFESRSCLRGGPADGEGNRRTPRAHPSDPPQTAERTWNAGHNLGKATYLDRASFARRPQARGLASARRRVGSLC
jgi:hypothetical protein